MRTHLYYKFVLVTLLFTTFLTSAQSPEKNNGQFVVVLDAGHGGKDPGKNSKYGYKEKDIALKITLKVGEYLEQNPNVKVIYTRKTDVFIELRDRPKIANDADADLFISIHCNAHHTEAYGTETFVLDVNNTNKNFEVAKAENEVIFLEDNYEEHYGGFNPNSPESLIGITLMQEEYTEQSILLASFIEKNFANKIKRKSRGIKQASLWVIHQTAMPSVLIETGFITNKNEGVYLNSPKGQTEVAKSIYDAIIDYKKSLDYNVGSHIFADIEPIVEDTKVVTPVIEDVSIPEEEIYTGIVFKIQIAASSNKLEPRPFNFSGLDDISREKEGHLFKYYYGYTSDYTKAKTLEDTAKKKGYKDCFIVAFKDGKRADLTEVLKSASN